MEADWIGLAAFCILVAGFAAVFVWLQKNDQSRRAALEALAKRRNWNIVRDRSTLGRPQTTKVSPRDGAGWSCTISRFQSQSGGSTTQIFSTDFILPRTAVVSGLVVVGPPRQDGKSIGVVDLPNGFGGSSLGGTIAKYALATFLGEELASADKLVPLANVSPDVASAFASTACIGTEAEDTVSRYVPGLRGWQGDHPDEKDFPILIVSDQSIRIRLRRDASDPAMLEAFVDFCLKTASSI